MGTNESFDVQNTSLLICLLLLWRSPCVRLNVELFTANMTQYHKVDSPIGNPKTHHTMHITAEACFVTGI